MSKPSGHPTRLGKIVSRRRISPVTRRRGGTRPSTHLSYTPVIIPRITKCSQPVGPVFSTKKAKPLESNPIGHTSNTLSGAGVNIGGSTYCGGEAVVAHIGRVWRVADRKTPPRVLCGLLGSHVLRMHAYGYPVTAI